MCGINGVLRVGPEAAPISRLDVLRTRDHRQARAERWPTGTEFNTFAPSMRSWYREAHNDYVPSGYHKCLSLSSLAKATRLLLAVFHGLFPSHC
jgi:hypothetical protein